MLIDMKRFQWISHEIPSKLESRLKKVVQTVQTNYLLSSRSIFQLVQKYI